MRIDTGSNEATRAISGSTQAAAPEALQEGDVLAVKVTALNSDGSVNVRTRAGQVLHARLDISANLQAGQDVSLTIVGKSGDTIIMSLSGHVDALDLSGAVASSLAPASLQAFSDALGSLGFAIDRQTLDSMRNLLTALPELTIPEAAFLAANDIKAGSPSLTAAQNLLINSADTAALIDNIFRLLSQSAPQGEAAGSAPELNTQLFSAPSANPTEGSNPVNTAVSGSIGDVGAAVSEAGDLSAHVAQEAAQVGVLTAPEKSATSNIGEIAATTPNLGEAATASPNLFEAATMGEWVTRLLGSAEGAGGGERGAGGVLGGSAGAPGGAIGAGAAERGAGVAPEDGGGAADKGAAENVSAALRQMPEFRRASEKSLREFSDALIRAAVDAAGVSESGGEGAAKKLTDMLSGLFTALPKGEENPGELLRRTKNELAVRLAFFEEALEQAPLSGKQALRAETQKLAEHIKLLGEINQFVYTQLPVTIAGKRTSAELYVYKNRKGKGKLDPTDARILVSLDLEHMGHTESFIRVRGKEVNLEMETASSAAKAALESSEAELALGLKEAGFRLAGLRITEKAAQTTPLTALLTLAAHERRQNPHLDFTI
ncbi:MAG: flagellar hook-length control protein FliK [Oscillospiraceae bacterium]|nr:flagellar hook-length control protein FliK [Oscillospiraceae bacterium]